jgi:hypothetical protein
VSGPSDLVLSIFRAFDKAGVLPDLVLIGSWTHLLYAHHFQDPPEIPAPRTLDIDFLIPRPSAIKREVDVAAVLSGLDFKAKINLTDGLIKYVHPDLQLEFLTPMLGKGQDKPYKVPKLKTNAIGLRLLDLLCGRVLVVSYHGLGVRVPEPAAYALHKLLLQTRRKNPEKKVKDREAALGVIGFLMKSDAGRDSLKTVLGEFVPSWRKEILAAVLKPSPEIHRFLSEG